MVESIIVTEGLTDQLIQVCKEELGLCDFCTLRYLGVKDPLTYRDPEAVQRILSAGKKEKDKGETANGSTESGVESPPEKMARLSPCSVCLGLLVDCIKEDSLAKIAEEINNAGIEAASYAPVLSLPIALMVRAHAVWFYLLEKFPQVYSTLSYMKPEGIAIKSVWKWLCTISLRERVDRGSEWMTNGDLVINICLAYKDDDKECYPLFKLLRNRNRRAELTRGTAEQAFYSLSEEAFRKNFKCPLEVPTHSLAFEKITCSHMAVFVAGRYCKYSRDVSQSPWLDSEGKRVRGEGSVQEFMQDHVKSIFNCDTIKFSASGREDSDVRMLGKGRPFVIEVINPKKTIMTKHKIKLLQKSINESTSLISVRDLQVVEKKDINILRIGEETKNKFYTALCKTPGKEVTPETLKILNDTPMPFLLQQITPLRVLHRRSLITRPRNILEMKAEAATRSKEMFILHVKTEAGTYVKEFVHGDCGRTAPSVADLLGYPTEILALDVADVELDWPPEIKDDI